MERVWLYLRSHYLSNRACKDYNDLFEALTRAWNALDESRFRSLCHEDWGAQLNHEAYYHSLAMSSSTYCRYAPSP
jgi:hypothetical protein